MLTLTCRSSSGNRSSDPPTARVSKGRIRVLVNSSGDVAAGGKVELKSKVSGQVLAVDCQLGGEVEQGDCLVTLDPTSAKRAVQRSEAKLNLEQVKRDQCQQKFNHLEAELQLQLPAAQEMVTLAETHVGDTETQFNAKQELFSTQQIPKTELDDAEKLYLDAQQALTTAHSRLEELSELEDHQEAARLDLELAKAHVAEMQVDLEEAKARETDTKILSPITGVVTALQVTPGQLVSSGITNSGGESLMTICDFSRINVEADITEADIAHLTNNLSARITSAVYPTKEFEGRIIRIAPQGVRQDEIVTFKVLIEVEDEEKHLLRPGMTAAVEIVALEKADVLLVPVNAVIEPERNPRVFIRDAQGNFNQHSITIGLSDGISCEVLTGLEAQDEVMLNLSASFLNNLP